MNQKACVLILAAVGSLFAPVNSAPAQGTAFTYQARLYDGGNPATGSYDLAFAVCTDSNGVNQIGGALTNTATPVSNGLFTVTLDFGSGIFTGNPLWLKIGVETNGGGGFTTLAPLQQLTPAPYAIYSPSAGAAASAKGVAAGSVTGAGIAGNSVVKSLNNLQDAVTLSPGANITITPSGNTLTIAGPGGGTNWSLTGNSGTTPGVDFLGTTDNQALELHVNGSRGWQLAPTVDSPNVIGGANVNSVALGVQGATISGGGSIATYGQPYPNTVGAFHGTIGGGLGNAIQTAALESTIAGGNQNSIQSNAHDSNIGGGYQNIIQSNAAYAAIGGGANNAASGAGATIGGGASNTNSAVNATIAGGYRNASSGIYATIGGGGNNTNSGIEATIGGGGLNHATGDYSTVAGGADNEATAMYAMAGGGTGNQANGTGSFVGGGGYDGDMYGNNIAGGGVSTVGGGLGNVSSGYAATVGGGYGNQANGPGSFIGGGGTDGTNYIGNLTSGAASTVGGGFFNNASGYVATVGGGYANRATESGSFVGGGVANVSSGYEATIGGGGNNTNSGAEATIGGGAANTNSGNYATIGGGQGNAISGTYATIPGGCQNVAVGFASFAAGQNATANDNNSFLWSDGSRPGVSQGTNSFSVLATGGVWFFTGVYPAGLKLAPGSSSWATLSDRNYKKNIVPVDYQAVLDKLAAVPIAQWNYQWEKDDDVPNIGPMAQDFKLAFYPGRDDKSITTLEFDGVELAAIQALNQKLQEESKTKDAEIGELRQSVAELKAMVSQLAQMKGK